MLFEFKLVSPSWMSKDKYVKWNFLITRGQNRECQAFFVMCASDPTYTACIPFDYISSGKRLPRSRYSNFSDVSPFTVLDPLWPSTLPTRVGSFSPARVQDRRSPGQYGILRGRYLSTLVNGPCDGWTTWLLTTGVQAKSTHRGSVPWRIASNVQKPIIVTSFEEGSRSYPETRNTLMESSPTTFQRLQS